MTATMNLSNSSNASVPTATGPQKEDEDYAPIFRAQAEVPPIIIAILIIALNSWVIVLVVKRQNLQTVTNFILASLAMSDLCTGVISIPLYLSCNITRITGFCTADMIVIIFTSVSTLLHILVMTIDRYICIIFALHYENWVTKRRGWFVIALIWFVSVFMGLIQLAWIDLTQDAQDDYDMETGRNFVIYDIFRSVAFIGIPVVFMAFSYAHIFYEVLRQTKNIQKYNSPGWQETQRCRTREWKVAALFLFMLLVFLVCWVPFSLLRVEAILHAEFFQLNLSDVAIYLLYSLRMCNSFINPCLYILGKPDFRKATGLRRKKSKQVNSELSRTSLKKSSLV